MTTSESVFVFNLGRLWQEVIPENWDEVKYLYKLIEDVTDPVLLKKYEKTLKRLQSVIEEKDYNGVDKTLKRILKW